MIFFYCCNNECKQSFFERKKRTFNGQPADTSLFPMGRKIIWTFSFRWMKWFVFFVVKFIQNISSMVTLKCIIRTNCHPMVPAKCNKQRKNLINIISIVFCTLFSSLGVYGRKRAAKKMNHQIDEIKSFHHLFYLKCVSDHRN